jgi:hypothetical protein
MLSEASPDADLLRQMSEGDAAAVGALYERHAPALMALAVRIVRDHSEAQDVLHDAFLLVNDRAGQYVPERRGMLARNVLAHDVEALGAGAARRSGAALCGGRRAGACARRALGAA